MPNAVIRMYFIDACRFLRDTCNVKIYPSKYSDINNLLYTLKLPNGGTVVGPQRTVRKMAISKMEDVIKERMRGGELNSLLS